MLLLWIIIEDHNVYSQIFVKVLLNGRNKWDKKKQNGLFFDNVLDLKCK